MSWLLIVGIALANNLDNVGIGMAYGATQRRIRPLINFWIALIGFVVTGIAGVAGRRLEAWISPVALRLLSAGLLCGIGMWFLLSSAGRPQTVTQAGRAETNPSAGQEREAGRSKDIGFGAATLLGVSLAINNIGGGFSAGLAHQSALWTALLSAVFSYVAIGVGSQSRHLLGLDWVHRHANMLAGALLLLIGLKQLF